MSEAALPLPAAPRGRSVEALFARYGPSYRWLVAVAAMIGTIAAILSSTIVNVALPEVMGAFGIGQDTAQLLSTAFLAAVTGAMLLNGWLVESFGLRATYALAVAIFVVGSFVAGLAPGMEVLIAGRVLQGMAAGMVQPLGMQVLFLVFPPDRRGSAMGIYAVGVVLAPALGPTLGGLMVDGFGWRSVFFLSVPFALAGLAMGLVFMPGRARSGPRPPFDAPGFALLVLALVALLTGLSSGQREGWGSNAVVIELSVALLAAAGFVLRELSTPAPMLNPRLFAVRDFGAAALVAVVYGAGIFGSTYLIPLFVQTIQGYTPTRAGLLLMPAGLAMLVVFPIAGRLADRLPAALPTATGLLIFSVSCWLQTGIGTDIPFWTLALWLVLGRVGLGISMPSMNAGALSALPAHWVGQGSGAINFARQFGGAIGVNLSSIWLERQTQLHAQALVATQDGHLGATREMLRELERLLGEGGVAEALRPALAQEHLSQAVLAQASLLAFRDTLLGVALACLLAVLPALLLKGRRGRR